MTPVLQVDEISLILSELLIYYENIAIVSPIKNLVIMLLEKMNVKYFVLGYIIHSWTVMFTCGIIEDMPLQKISENCPAGRRRKGRPRNSWAQEVRTTMGEKGINNMEWIDREDWRRKIKL